MTKDDGGPAFPLSPGDVPYYEPGMSLRDWFAGQALAGIITADDHTRNLRDFALVAYAIADAMLAAKGGPHDDR